jgi:hypothetical protein
VIASVLTNGTVFLICTVHPLNDEALRSIHVGLTGIMEILQLHVAAVILHRFKPLQRTTACTAGGCCGCTMLDEGEGVAGMASS